MRLVLGGGNKPPNLILGGSEDLRVFGWARSFPNVVKNVFQPMNCGGWPKISLSLSLFVAKRPEMEALRPEVRPDDKKLFLFYLAPLILSTFPFLRSEEGDEIESLFRLSTHFH